MPPALLYDGRSTLVYNKDTEGWKMAQQPAQPCGPSEGLDTDSAGQSIEVRWLQTLSLVLMPWRQHQTDIHAQQHSARSRASYCSPD